MDGMYSSRLLQTEKTTEKSAEMRKSLEDQRSMQHGFSRLMFTQGDEALSSTSKFTRKMAKKMVREDHLKSVNADLDELTIAMAPIEESDKDRKERLSELARARSQNKDADHISLAIMEGHLTAEKSTLIAEKDIEDNGRQAVMQRTVEALLATNPDQDFLSEEYLTTHARDAYALIESASLYEKLSGKVDSLRGSADDPGFVAYFDSLTAEQKEMLSKMVTLSKSVKEGMDTVCRMKGIDPATGDFSGTPLTKKEHDAAKNELTRRKDSMKAVCKDAIAYKKEKFPEPVLDKAQKQQRERDQRDALARRLQAEEQKRAEIRKVAEERRRIKMLTMVYGAEQETQSSKACIERAEQYEYRILSKVEDEKALTHLLINIDTVKSMGRELDALIDSYNTQKTCVEQHYRERFHGDPSDTLMSVLREQEQEIQRRQVIFSQILDEINTQIPSADTSEDTKTREASAGSALLETAEQEVANDHPDWTPEQKRKEARDMLVRMKRKTTMVHLEEQRAKNRSEEVRKMRDRFAMWQAGKGMFQGMNLDEIDVYTWFSEEYKSSEKYQGEELPDSATMEIIVQDFLKSVVAHNQSMQIRVPNCEILGRILDSGRLLSQVETGTGGGDINPELRKEFTASKYGVKTKSDKEDDPSLLKKEDYEIYGYLSDGDHVREAHYERNDTDFAKDNLVGRVAQYGQVIIKLKPEAMLARTSITFGDSLDIRNFASPAMLDNPDMFATKFEDREKYYEKAYEWYKKKQAGLDDEADTMTDLNEVLKGLNISYVELQFHGGVHLADIESVTLVPKFKRKDRTEGDTDIPPELLERLRASNIHAYVVKDGEKTEK
ncbi:MAG: hypothetical protein K5697_11790 [Lachnospiraceae bacterium]|nr:hypothetical protein [Lachnospiraceae bacterium]